MLLLDADNRLLASADERSAALTELEPQIAAGLLLHATTFCPPLHDIMSAAESAADAIRRVVWNGQLNTSRQSGEQVRLKSILEQISGTGIRSSEMFAQSILDLFETVLAAGLRTTESISHLLVDLLDRNLYERANDYRWWAVTTVLRTLLAQPEHSPVALVPLQTHIRTQIQTPIPTHPQTQLQTPSQSQAIC